MANERRFLYLLVSLAVLILVAALMGPGMLGRLLADAAFLLVLGSTVRALSRRRWEFRVAVAVGLAAMAAAGVNLLSASPSSALARALLGAVFLGFAVVAILREVLADEAVTADKIRGAICAYLLIGAFWAFAYSALIVLDPAALAPAVPRGEEVSRPVMYFSFVTLTTLGYGDILPVSRAARTLAWMEAGVGQLYLAVLIARLVGLHLAHTTRKG